MNRLQLAAKQNGPLCIGLDTDPSYLPPEILKKYPSNAKAVEAYNQELIQATSEYASCYKVQIAYYEAMGLEGLQVYANTIQTLRNKNIPVISDIKRGDIADTAKAYAKAHFTGDFESDIITINPYMGFDTLEPFSSYCSKTNTNSKGLFVLLRTSNPGMNDIENEKISNGKPLFEKVGEHLLTLANKYQIEYGYQNDVCSPIGAVVGCTEENQAKEIRTKYSNIFFLIPGYGAQGGKATIAGILLNKAGGVVNSSRGILCAWKKDENLTQKTASSSLTLSDIVLSATNAAQKSKKELIESM